MTNEQFALDRGAFTAWMLAINSALLDVSRSGQWPLERSIETMAKAYGKAITTPESLERVGEWFNWDELTNYLRELKAVSKGNTNVNPKQA